MKKIRVFFVCFLAFLFGGSFQSKSYLYENSLPTASTHSVADSALAVAISLQKKLLAPVPDTTRPHKYVYLTIDDAPMRGSQYIDSVIQAKQVKTSIFFVGSMLKGSRTFQKNYDRLSQNPYVEACNHSYSHANHQYASYYQEPQKVMDDIYLNQTELQLSNAIVRLPGRNTWQLGKRSRSESKPAGEAAKLLADNGYQVFGWDIEWGYEKDGTPTQTVDELMARIEEAQQLAKTFTKNHVIVLMHDQMFKQVHKDKSLEALIDQLNAHNYTFRYLCEYPH